MANKPHVNSVILAVLSNIEDRAILASILALTEWKPHFTADFEEARGFLNKSRPRAVISDRAISDSYDWRDLLLKIQQMEDPPPLIVADRGADERLWAEVLNLGACDLLAQPFDAREVLYAVAAAGRRHETERRTRPGHVLEATRNAAMTVKVHK